MKRDSKLRLYFVILAFFVASSSYGEDIATCEVEPSRDFFGDMGDFVAEVAHDTAEVAGSVFLGDKYAEDARLGYGDTIWDAAFIFGIAALANYRTIGNLAFAFTRYLYVNDISDKSERVVKGELSQSALDKPQKRVAAIDNKWIPFFNSSDVRNLGNWLIHKGFPWLTNYKVPNPPLETAYTVDGGTQRFGIIQRPPEKDDEDKEVNKKTQPFFK